MRVGPLGWEVAQEMNGRDCAEMRLRGGQGL